METKFKDVAHLYIGCKIYSDFCGMITTETLIGVLNGILIYQGNTEDGIESTSDISIPENKDKPYLRELSSMTHEELKEFFVSHSLLDLTACTFEYSG